MKRSERNSKRQPTEKIIPELVIDSCLSTILSWKDKGKEIVLFMVESFMLIDQNT